MTKPYWVIFMSHYYAFVVSIHPTGDPTHQTLSVNGQIRFSVVADIAVLVTFFVDKLSKDHETLEILREKSQTFLGRA